MEIGGLVADVRPGWLGHCQEVAICLQSPVEEPLGLVLFGGDSADGVFVEAGLDGLGLDGGLPPVLVLAIGKLL